MFVSTKILQLSLIVSFGSLTREETFVGTILALVFLVALNACSIGNIAALHFLADYYNIYRATTFCCGCKPFVHKSIIFEYLKNPLRFTNDFEPDEHFPAFLNVFLNNKNQHLNSPSKLTTFITFLSFAWFMLRHPDICFSSDSNKYIQKQSLGLIVINWILQRSSKEVNTLTPTNASIRKNTWLTRPDPRPQTVGIYYRVPVQQLQ